MSITPPSPIHGPPSPRADEPTRTPRNKTWHGGVSALCAWIVFALLYLPLLAVVAMSLNASTHGLQWQGFTLGWYRKLANDPLILQAARNTVVLGVCSTAIATILGTLLGYGLNRRRNRGIDGGSLIDSLLQIPVFIPDIVMASALLLFYACVRKWTGLFQLGMTTMIVSHVTFQIPFVAMVVRARLEGMAPSLAEAAADLGCSPRQTFWHVTLPLAMPGILAGALLAFTLSLDDFVVSFFTSGPGSATLPIHIYASVKRGLSPEIHALATLLFLASILATLGLMRVRPNARGH